MKRLNLVALLRETPVVHPTRIEQVIWKADRLTIEVRGHRWWADPGEDEAEGGISLVFTGLEDGCLRPDALVLDDDEALEDLSVIDVSLTPWAQACEWSIYTSGPVAQPERLFALVHDYLAEDGACFGPERFLNGGRSISRFTTIAEMGGSHVATGPACIRDLICAELERQSTPFNLVHSVAGPAPCFLVRLGDSAFLCREAFAEIADA